LALDFGLMRALVRAPVPTLAFPLRSSYVDFPVVGTTGFFDVTASLSLVSGMRRWVRPQVTFLLDGKEPFEPFPVDTHLPLLEWGLNWAIAHRCNSYLLLHAGAVEREGRGVLLPALPTSGKSTLTAALSVRGYRLLSDEFGALRLTDGMLAPALRPISLKNESIEIIRSFSPPSTVGPEFPKTKKGRVAYFAPDAASVAGRHQCVPPALIVFPRYVPEARTTLAPMSKSRAFAKLAANSFNYEILGPEGFEAMGTLIERCACFRLEYSRLEEAIAVIDYQVAGCASAATAKRLATVH
jgi:HprK-related kinase A